MMDMSILAPTGTYLYRFAGAERDVKALLQRVELQRRTAEEIGEEFERKADTPWMSVEVWEL